MAGGIRGCSPSRDDRRMLDNAPRIRRFVLAGIFVCVATGYPGVANALTFIVNSTLDAVDAVPGNGICATAGGACTLRAAVQEANGLPGADVILLPAGTYLLTIGGAGEQAGATGDLDITSSLTINGAGSATTIVDGNAIDRVFEVSGGTIIMNDVTVRNGELATDSGGCIFVRSASFALVRSVVKGCHALSGGGIAGTGLFAAAS